MIGASRLREATVAMLVAAVAVSASASDKYLIQGLADGPKRNDVCEFYEWLGDALFHNSTNSAQTITLVDISNGSLAPGTPRTLTIQPGRTASLNRSISWTPNPTTAPYVIHLDVPDGIIVESRFEIGGLPCTLP